MYEFKMFICTNELEIFKSKLGPIHCNYILNEPSETLLLNK